MCVVSIYFVSLRSEIINTKLYHKVSTMSSNKIMYESGFHLYGYKLENKIGDCNPVSSFFKDKRFALRAFRNLKKRGFDAIELRYLSPKFFEDDKNTK